MKIISYSERQLLLFATATISYFVFVSFATMYNASVAVQQQELLSSANSGVSFGIYELHRASSIPFANVLSFFLLLIVYDSRKYLFSTFFTILPLACYSYEMHRGIGMIISFRYDFPDKTIYELILKVASIYDYAVFILLTSLFFWQISIIFRSVIKYFLPKFSLK
jgi:hypothetical protein